MNRIKPYVENSKVGIVLLFLMLMTSIIVELAPKLQGGVLMHSLT